MTATATATNANNFYLPVRIKLYQLTDNTRNARLRINETKTKELAESMKANGLQNRIVVRQIGPDKYEVKQGSRRFAAAKLLKWEEIEAHLAPDTMTEKSHDLASLVENLQRESLTPYEEAMGYRQLSVDYSMSGADISKATGISASHVNNSIRAVSNLSPEILEQWKAGNKLGANFDTMVKLASIKGKDGEPDHASQNKAWEGIAKGGKFIGGQVIDPTAGADGESEGETAAPGNRKQAARVLMKNVLNTAMFLKESDSVLKPPADMKSWVAGLIAYFLGKRSKPPEGIVIAKYEPKAKKAKAKKGKKKVRKAE
jgi:ParB/RepB/Spo0J family partition protein